ncbi:MAG: aminopeptidase P family protein [Planctomycetaceae bacterium]|nr:aminopeptidase P family protein [Planctomycetaceae bacterium]
MSTLITAEGCQARRRRLWDALNPRPDLILIAQPQHLSYLSNYYASPYVFRTANAQAVLILGADGSSTLVADSMVRGFAEEAFVDDIVAPTWYDGRHSAPIRGELLATSLLDALHKKPGVRLGVESSGVSAGVLDRLREQRGTLELVAVDAALHQLKRSKDPDELEILRRSLQASDAGYAAALKHVHPGMTELDACLLVHRAAAEAAGQPVLIYGDFVSGPRTGDKGGPPSQRVIERGDLVLLDYSVILRGYRGDVCNTFVCGAKPSAEQRRLHAACLEALTAGERMLRPGQHAREVDRAVRSSFDAQHLTANFTSHSGHGLGLGHPDPPYFVPESSDVLVAGDVVALEPGLYFPGKFGMRFEHNFVVTSGGPERLSNHQLELAQSGI